jgi:hypothetical protein
MKESGKQDEKRPEVGDKMGRTYFDMNEVKHRSLFY